MRRANKLLAAAAAVTLSWGIGVSPAHAGMIVDNWTIDLGASGEGDLAGKVVGIDEITFKALFRAISNFTGAVLPSGDVLPNIGDTGDIFGTYAATSLQGDAGEILQSDIGEAFKLDFEITGEFRVDIIITSPLVPTNQTFTHQGLATSFLDIYVDDLDDDGLGNNLNGVTSNVNPSTGGEGMVDGTLIASFELLPGLGGSFNSNTLNGSDNAKFLLSFVQPGVLLNEFGNPLAVGEILAFTSSTTDTDPDNNNIRDTQPPNGPFAQVGFTCGFTTGGTQTNQDVCGSEDGSFNLRSVPEPGTIALFGLALAGLGVSLGRRRTRGTA